MDKKVNCYQESFSVLRDNVGRTVAILLFLASVILFLLLEADIILRLVPGKEESLFDFGNSSNRWISLAFFVMAFLLLLPLEIGIKRWFYCITKDKRSSLREVFSYFNLKIYKKALLLRIVLILITAISYFCCLLPAFVMEWLTGYLDSYHTLFLGILYGVFSILTVFAYLLGLAFGFYWNLRYFLVDFLFFESEETSVTQLIKDSVFRMTKPRVQAKVFGMYMVLFPFYLLSVLIVPLIFLLPYLYLLTAVKGRELLFGEEDKDTGLF